MTRTHAEYSRWMEPGMKWYLFPRYGEFRRATAALLDPPPDGAVLDFGCGVGLLEEHILPRLSERGTVTGVDIGERLVAAARARFAGSPRASFRVVGDTGILPFPDASFDRAASSLVMHLLDRPRKEAVLGELHRVLKPGGHAVLAEIGRPEGIHGRWVAFVTLSFWARVMPYEGNSRDSFRGLLPDFLKDAGFREVAVARRMLGFIDFLVARK